MISFGEKKNNIQMLKKLLQRGKAYDKFAIKDIQLQLTNNNPSMFLQLISYFLVDYSSTQSLVLFRQILQIAPNIRVTSDRQFIEIVFNICRKIFKYDPPLKQQQFFTDKFFDRKLQLLVNVAKNVLNNQQNKKKKSINTSTTGNNSSSFSNKLEKKNVFSDDQQQMPKQFKVKPIEYSNISSSKNFAVTQMNHKPSRSQQIIQHIPSNVFPKKHPSTTKQIILSPQSTQQQDDSQKQQRQYITREQFNEALQLLATVNTTVNNVVEKFNVFQNNVSGWVNNINAKVSILQQNVKFIKNNM